MSATTANPEKVKRRARNSRESTADKYCDSCHQNITEYEKRDMLRVTNRYDKNSRRIIVKNMNSHIVTKNVNRYGAVIVSI